MYLDILVIEIKMKYVPRPEIMTQKEDSQDVLLVHVVWHHYFPDK